MRTPLRGRRLAAGDRIRLVSPASYPTREGVADATRILAEWGLVPEVALHAFDEWGFMAGRDADRLADLDDAFRDPGVRAVVATRGGAGAYRIADRVDPDAVRADPKPVLGLSDITGLHLALWQRCGLAGVHGCLFGERAVASARHILMDAAPVTLHSDPAAPSAAVAVPGRATGTLLGGNLRTVQGFVGAGMPTLDGALLCLEDEGRYTDPAVLDATLWQLRASGSLDGLRGVALGDLTGIGEATAEVYRYRLGTLGVPILGGLPFGHLPDQTCVPLGTTATLDATAGTLTVAPAVT